MSLKNISALSFVIMLAMPSSALAAEASAQAILNAIAEGTANGICTSQSESSGSSCVKTKTVCSPTAWAKYIEANYQNNGGSISLKTGSSSGIGATLTRYKGTPTQDMSNQATAILAQHRAAFPGCAGCLTDAAIARCGVNTDYPFPGNASLVGRVAVHTNVAGTPNANGCPHLGVEVFVSSAGATPGGVGTGQSAAYLAADWERNKNTPPDPVQRGTCYCACGASDSLSACNGKPPGFGILTSENRTAAECKMDCGSRAVAEDKCRVAPFGGASGASAGAGASALCFSAADCQDANGIFEAGTGGCAAGQGRCYAQEPEVKLNTPIGSVTKIQGLGKYVATAYGWVLSIVAIASTIMFVWGAFRYLIGTALPTIAGGKEAMKDAIVGMILVLSATAILRTVNPATTHLDTLKAYMINTRLFLNVAICKDMPAQVKLALAGTKPNLTPYETVAANESAFAVSPAQAECGKSYWAKDSVGSSCDGSACAETGYACVSCADGTADGCNKTKSTKRVCQKTTFSGTVTYADKRVPEEVTMIFLCNFGQPTTPATAAPDAVTNQWSLLDSTLGKTGFESGGTKTNESQTGQAVYRFPLTAQSLDRAVTFCANKGGLRGAVLGVQYNDDTIIDPVARAVVSVGLTAFTGPGAVAGIALAATTPADDFTIVSRANCGNAHGAFDGYGSGHNTSFDTTDLAKAMLCGFSKGRLLDGPGTYWKEPDLRAAISGSAPITCDFALNHDTVASDPGSACPANLQ